MLLFGLGVAGYAQTAVDGAVSGSVVDAGNAAIQGARIRLRNPATALEQQATSDQRGEFLAARLPPGDYEITITSPGFAIVTLQNVLVELGTVTSVPVHLPAASVSTNITVTPPEDDSPKGVTPAPPTAITSVVTQAELNQLPSLGRRWQDAALLTPTANPNEQGDNLLSFRGLAVTQNSTAIDGMNSDQSFNAVPRGADSAAAEEGSDEQQRETGSVGLNQGARRHTGTAYTFSQEAVREFRISSQDETALYGHGSGGIITTVSRGGANTLHGTGFYSARESAWGATNPFSIATHYNRGAPVSAAVKPHDLRQQFGGSVGGAAIRDRLFYFYAYDQRRRNFPAISSPADPAFFSLTATQKALLAHRGVSAAKTDAALRYLDSLTGTLARRSGQTINFGKLDWQANERHRLSAQYNRAHSSSPAGLRTSAVVDRGRASFGSAYASVDAGLVRWLWVASPAVTNELRVAYGHELQYQLPQPPLPQEPAIGPGGYAPEVSIGPQGFIFGTPAALGRKAFPEESRLQAADLVSWAHGRHLVQAGFDFSAVHDRIDALNNTEGTFHYDSGTTSGHAGGLVDWITDYTFNVNAYPSGGCPSIHAPVHEFCFRSYTQSFGQPEVSFGTQEWAAFVQDNWRVRPSLTLNLGLRYEYELEPLPQQPNAALDAVFSHVGATSVFPEDRNNIGPRVGVAWEPLGSGHGVVRAAYGVYYGILPGATIESALANTATGSSTTHVRITPSTVTYCPQAVSQGFGYACSYVTTPPAAVGLTTTATVFDRRFRLPMVEQGSLSVEREVGAGVVASAAYLVNLDRQLPNSVDINIAPSTATRVFQLQGGTGAVGVRDGERFVLPVYTQRISANYGPVTDIVSNTNASYNALSLEARRRSRGGLDFRASWTWAKAIDYGQSSSAAPRINNQTDPFSVAYDKGLSRLNFPHKLVASAVWTPRLRVPELWLQRAGSGWSIAGIFTERSGRPYSYEIFGGTRLSGGRESINGSGGAVYLPTVGRDTLRLPDTANLDLRLSRTVPMTEHVHARAFAEVFNVANHVNYSGIVQRAFLVGTPVAGVTPLIFQDAAAIATEGLNQQPFGTFTAASAGSSGERQVQVGLRVEF
ncbi:TonB-dependent receptor domain-containing protein [Edaphobacter bradus]|uniref:TonB-dependent receptor domain-containing protein n=1 Tax=Edaphobacter bradus TaxID=2259016 RepID=UPI0021E0F625|nr:TonB-dependent receptor [Edaphobacter bradus]